MEYNYSGIKPESIELLCLNRFNDSKEFYEGHKEELKNGITVPLRQIVSRAYPCSVSYLQRHQRKPFQNKVQRKYVDIFQTIQERVSECTVLLF